MDYYEMEKDYASCIIYAEKYLSVDPYSEGVYRRLMTCHLQDGSRERVAQIYERCKKHVSEGLDCSVSRETEKVYRQLIQQPEE